ncbi:MAG: GNAT family N-acetyltransferase [Xanthobacteraceae bacterium]|nr:GNAT family N-acetyltransferase [Xanthobacteraceae bacterium]
MAASDSKIGLLGPEDLGDADALVKEAGWNQTEADWRIFLDLGAVFAIRDRGRIVATAATLPYGRKFAWISMVLIAGEYRRRGLATQLMERCIETITAAGLVPILDATPAGREVYLGLGFQDSWPFQRMLLKGRAKTSEGTSPLEVEPVTDKDWNELCTYDAKWFGADRSAVLSRLRGRLPEAEALVRRSGKIAGFLLGRKGRRAAQIGPLVADDPETAAALLEYAAGAVAAPVYIDVMDDKAALIERLRSTGFVHERPYTRMMLGRSESFQDLPHTFAVAGPELG